jgi:6-phosphogluconolactonase (cycloisomerase 2 family)
MMGQAITLVVAAAAAFGLLAAEAEAQVPNGAVYIESDVGDVPGQNSVLAFRRNSNGTLTQTGTFPTGGTGVHPIAASLGNLPATLGPFDSDQDLIFNADATQLFAVNSGSDTIAVFNINTDGSLVPVKGSPFPSGGRQPVSLGLAAGGSILTVVNKDYDTARPGFDIGQRAPNYTALRVNPDGKLISVPFSTVIAGQGGTVLGPGNPEPSQALIGLGGRLVFDADTFGTAIHSLRVDANGRLEAVTTLGTPPAAPLVPLPLPNPTGRAFVLGLAAHPSAQVFYAGFIAEGQVGVYRYNQAGDFHFVKSVFAGLGICWIRTNAAGNRIYTSNTLVNTISVLDSSDPLNPFKLQEFSLAGPVGPPMLPGQGTTQIALDGRGEYLYVVTQQAFDFMTPEANALHALRLGADGKIDAQTDRVTIPVSPSLPQGVIAK